MRKRCEKLGGTNKTEMFLCVCTCVVFNPFCSATPTSDINFNRIKVTLEKKKTNKKFKKFKCTYYVIFNIKMIIPQSISQQA